MRILIIGSDSVSTKILYNSLNDEFKIDMVILEKEESRFYFIKRRFKKLGVLKVLDQLIFMSTYSKILYYLSRNRITKILHNNNLSDSSIPEHKIKRVHSANSNESVIILKKFSVDLIVLSGTRIISKKIINEVNTPIVNIHAGITPNFRGVHGAYWALVRKEKNLAGVTLHYVDFGVDTGGVISQDLISITEDDNYSTYPFLQLSCGINLLKEYITQSNKSLAYNGKFYGSKIYSNQWFHPGFFEYIYNRIVLGVK